MASTDNDDESIDLSEIRELDGPEQEAEDQQDGEDEQAVEASGEDQEGSDDGEGGDDGEGQAASDDAEPEAAVAERVATISREIETVVEQLPQIDAYLNALDAEWEKLSAPVNLDVTQFQNDAEYFQAVAREEMRKQGLAAIQQQAAQMHERRKQARLHVWSQQAEIGRSKYKDFDQVMAANTFTPSPAVAEAIVSTPHGADVAYALSKDPKLAARLSRLSPIAAAIEVGRLAASLNTPAKKGKAALPSSATKVGKAPATKSKAPPPPPRAGGRAAVSGRSIEKMGIAELRRSLRDLN